MTVTDLAIVGVGKIARDQHIPSIARNPGFRLAATVSHSGGTPGVENFASLEDLLAARPDITAIALCTPPQVRFDLAWTALQAGRNVLLEKPPGASVSEVLALKQLAADKGLTLYATWHSRHAAAVAQAKAWARDNPPREVSIVWKEDVRRWHPGQDWIWQAGGTGVFDPGINALSIMTEILPQPVHLTSATLTFPENKHTPIAAHLSFQGPDGLTASAAFDWRQTGPQSWDITLKSAGGTLALSRGGAEMTIDEVPVVTEDDTEYDGIYERFAALLNAGTSDVDLAPLVHVADAFMLGKRLVTEAFYD